MSNRRFRTIDLTMIGVFVALMAIGANISSFLIVGGVPITLQTFFCLLAGAILGKRIGAIAMIVYTLIGLAGVPVFSQFTGGIGKLLQPTFGFILSYILVAYITGWIIEKAKEPTVTRFIFAALIGMVINYLLGTNWMYYAYKFWAQAPEGFSYWMAWSWMIPPLPKDIILSVVAGVIAPRIYKVVQKSNPLQRQTVA